MKVYLEEKDIGRKITTYHDGLGTQQGLYVYGEDKIEVLSLADYTKQVQKKVLDDLMNMLGDRAELIDCGVFAEFMFTTYDLEQCVEELCQ